MGDYDTAERIMALHEPRQLKQLGREVKNFDDELWTKNRQKIVEKGNMAKVL